jgi:hypothetical protein
LRGNVKDRIFEKAFTVAARCLGVLFLVFSLAALLGALMDPQLRTAFGVAGVFSLVIGIGLLWAKGITGEEIDKYFKKK